LGETFANRVDGYKEHDYPKQGVPCNWVDRVLFGLKREVANEYGRC
jgi:hypothetical protein